MNDTYVPEFTIAMRGYDRMQVADYLGRLREYAAELEIRLARAERAEADLRAAIADCQTENNELAAQVHGLTAERDAAAPAGLAPRLERILELAEEEASETRRAAVVEAAEVRQAARDEADTTLAAARAEAASAVAAAQAEADTVLAEAHRAADEATADVEDLLRRRAAVVGDLLELASTIVEVADTARRDHLEAQDADVVDAPEVDAPQAEPDVIDLDLESQAVRGMAVMERLRSAST
jgi:cell division septum initiation protein DivIVA